MKKFLFLGIAATAMFASCTNDEMVEMNPQSAIGFETFVDKSTRAATDVTTDNLTAFWVYGWRTKGTTTEQIFNAQEVTANEGVNLESFQVGTKVFHKKFGEGVITKTEPEDDDLKVDIEFAKAGNKRLMAKFANLEIIE